MPYETEAKITSKGQITVPSQVRASLGVGPGDKLVFSVSDKGDVVIRRRKRRSIIDIARENPLPPGDYDIDKAIDDAMWRRERRARSRRSR